MWSATIRCDTAEKAAELRSRGPSGLFVPAEIPPRVGTRIALRVILPGDKRATLDATVIEIVDATRAAEMNSTPGVIVVVDVREVQLQVAPAQRARGAVQRPKAPPRVKR